jgi:phosphoglucomutase
LAGEKIETILTQTPGNNEAIGGLKVISKGGWFVARPSGTEDIYRIYAESFHSDEHLQRILQEAQTIVDSALKKNLDSAVKPRDDTAKEKT